MPKRLDEISEIHLIPYSHHDHAWTNTRQWHIWRYIEGYTRVLDVMKERPDYTLTVDNVLHSGEVFFKYCPSRAQEMRDRVREGRVAVLNGGKCLIRASLVGGEAFIRNMQAGRRELTELFGPSRMTMFFNADTAVAHSQMPQLLTLGGHDHYRFYRPEAALDRMGVPRQLVWKGLDGTEIIASRDIYGGFMWAHWAKMDPTDWPARRDSFIQEDLADRLRYGASAHVNLNVGCDDVFPLTNLFDEPIDLYGFMEDWNKHEKPVLRMSTPYRFHDALKAEPLPVLEGPLDACDLAFNLPARSQGSIWRARFETERLLLTAEKLGFLLEALGGQTDSRTEASLWNQFFDFSGHAMEWLLTDDFNEKQELSLRTRAEARSLIADRLDRIASLTRRQNQVQYAVVNTEPFARKELVELLVTTPLHVHGLTLLDERGNRLPYQVTRLYDGDKAYVNREYNEVKVVCLVDVPPMGAASVVATNSDAPMVGEAAASLPEDNVIPYSQDLIIDSGLFVLTLQNGLPVRISAGGETLYDRRRDGGFAAFAFHHTHPKPDWEVSYEPTATDEFISRETRYTERGLLRHTVELDGQVGGKPASLRLRLTQGSPRIDISFEVEHDGTDGYYAAAFPCDARPDITAGIPFGEEPKDTETQLYMGDREPQPGDELFNCERGLIGGFSAHSYMAYNFKRRRFALLQGDCSTYYRNLRGSGRVELMLMRALDLSKRTSRWMRNVHPSLNGKGPQSFSFSLCILPAGADAADVRRESQKAENPLLWAPRYSCEPGAEATPFSALSIEGGSLCLSAAYREQDEWVLRLYECAGRPGSCRLTGAASPERAYTADLCGNPLQGRAAISTDGDKALKLSYSPFEIITLRIPCPPPQQS